MLKEVRNVIASQVHTDPQIKNRAFAQSLTFPVKRVIIKTFREAPPEEPESKKAA